MKLWRQSGRTAAVPEAELRKLYDDGLAPLNANDVLVSGKHRKQEAKGKIVKTYMDKVKCPSGHKFNQPRRISTASRKVSTHCQACGRDYQIMAGPVPAEKGGGDVR